MISKLLISYPRLAACWSINTRDSFVIVGESLGIWSTSGSSKPSTTDRAFAFKRGAWTGGFGDCSLESPADSFGSFPSFQSEDPTTSHHILSGNFVSEDSANSFSVDNQLSISLALAASNSFRSCGFKLEILTSLRCLFAADTRKVISSGQVSSFQWSASLWLMFTSNLNT